MKPLDKQIQSTFDLFENADEKVQTESQATLIEQQHIDENLNTNIKVTEASLVQADDIVTTMITVKAEETIVTTETRYSKTAKQNTPMKYIKEFVEEDRVETLVMVAQVSKGVTDKGSPYLTVVFQDKTGQIEGKLWDAKPDHLQKYAKGEIGLLSAQVLKYRNGLQLKINDFVKRTISDQEMGRFVPESDVPVDVLKKVIEDAIDQIEHKHLKTLVQALIFEDEDRFFTYPAASKNHHDFKRGLADHVSTMLKLGDAMYNVYKDVYPGVLNRDLLIAGILMHDVGKLVELSGPGIVEYTMQGKLLGHISIMQAQIASKAEKLGFAEDEMVLLLRHMVLSHHGKYEYGSPVLPQIPEAEILTYIDNIDARMNMMNKALADVSPGEFAQRVFALENRTFYKMKNENNQ